MQTGRPWGVLKWAMGLDGRTALSNGASQWISGAPARAWVHQLRAGCDAVIVGGRVERLDGRSLWLDDGTGRAAIRLPEHATATVDEVAVVKNPNGRGLTLRATKRHGE